MTLLGLSQKTIATAIAFSLLLQAGLQAVDSCRRSMLPCTSQCGSRMPACAEQCPCGEECPCGENCACTSDAHTKGCPCNKPKPKPRSNETCSSTTADTKGCPCNKPRPKPRASESSCTSSACSTVTKGCPCNKPKPPKSSDTINELLCTMMCDASQAGCCNAMPTSVRTCYDRAQRDQLTPENIMYAMPTLLRYALEHMSLAEDTTKEQRHGYVDALVRYMEEHTDALRCSPTCSEVMDIMKHAAERLNNCTPLAERMASVVNTMTPTTRGGGCCSSGCHVINLTELSSTFSIMSPGSYCLDENSTADILIAADDVALDLNGRKLTGTITISGKNCSVKNGTLFAPAPTDNNAEYAAVEIQGTAENTRLCCLTIECENSTEMINYNGVNGRGGILNNGQKSFVLDCCITSGAGAHGDTECNDANVGVGGNGGFGIKSSGLEAQIQRDIVKTGNGGNGSCACVGNVNGECGGNGGTGIELTSTSTSSCIIDCKITTGNGGNGGNSCCENGGCGGNGGDGIVNDGYKDIIDHCVVCTGNGGNGGFSDDGNTVGGHAGNGGIGIRCAQESSTTQIINNLISTGFGGNGGSNDPLKPNNLPNTGGNGGKGGDAILVEGGACNTEIRNNVVERTGFGGNGGNAAVIGTGGNGERGGDAVFIEGPNPEAQSTEVRLNTLSHTGEGGQGGSGNASGTPGRNGRAVTDNNDDTASSDAACPATNGNARSIIYSNFAYAISNTSERYANSSGAEFGVNVTTPPTFVDNVYAA